MNRLLAISATALLAVVVVQAQTNPATPPAPAANQPAASQQTPAAPPQTTGTATAPATGNHRVLQAKSQEELKAYQDAFAKPDAALCSRAFELVQLRLSHLRAGSMNPEILRSILLYRYDFFRHSYLFSQVNSGALQRLQSRKSFIRKRSLWSAPQRSAAPSKGWSVTILPVRSTVLLWLEIERRIMPPTARR